jgi:hypothetical protein
MIFITFRKSNTALRSLGQSLIEYAILLAFLVTALTAMKLYLQRGIQASIKMHADVLAPQELWRYDSQIENGWSANYANSMQNDQTFPMGARNSTVDSKSFNSGFSISRGYTQGY